MRLHHEADGAAMSLRVKKTFEMPTSAPEKWKVAESNDDR